jgi:hypothetical protein
MAERSSLNQISQIGVETTPGTAVAATKRLQSISIEPSISAEIDQFRPVGSKYRSIATLGKEWVEASIGGRADYNELPYIFSSVINTGVITTPAGGTLSRQWVFISSTTADDTPKTFTVEHGSSVRGDRFAYGLINEFSMTFNRTSIEISGAMMGRAITDPFTLTSSGVTSPALSPVVPTTVSVFMDTTSVGLGTTKLTRLLNCEVSLGSRFGPVWVLDAANQGWVAHVETEPDLTLNMTMEADAQAMAFLTQLRDGSTRFVRISAVGTLIETTIAYSLQIDLAVKIVDTGGFSDEDGVYAIEWNFVGVNDATWGQAMKITVVNSITAL